MFIFSLIKAHYKYAFSILAEIQCWQAVVHIASCNEILPLAEEATESKGATLLNRNDFLLQK